MRIPKIGNLAENLIIIIVVGLLGGVVGYTAATKSHKVTLEKVQPTLDKAIEKATNEITNKIEVPKIKKSQGLELILTPQNEQIAVRDTCMSIDWSKLSDGQKRRLRRWLGD